MNDADAVRALRERYLFLLKRALTHLLYDEEYHIIQDPHRRLRRLFAGLFRLRGLELVELRPYSRALRNEGKDVPPVGQTMAGLRRLDDLHLCIETVLKDAVPGDLIEAGVWRGGVGIFMRACLEAYGDSDRSVYLADSFAGLPPPSPGRFPADRGFQLHREKVLAVSQDDVRRNFEIYGFLDDRVHFVPGWFESSLAPLKGRTWSVIRLDADMYESTTQALGALYEGLSPGGFAIIDDYGAFEQCRLAVDEYRQAHGITEPLEWIDWTCVRWRRRGGS